MSRRTKLPRCLDVTIFIWGAVGFSCAQQADDPVNVALGVLQQRAQQAIASKDYATMETLTRSMVTLSPQWADAYYLACALAMQGKREMAGASLAQSVALGFGYAIVDGDRRGSRQPA